MKQKNDEVAELKRRLEAEKKINAALKRRINRLTAETAYRQAGNSYDTLMASGSFLFYSDSFFSYVIESLRSTSVYSRWDRFLIYYRRLRMISVSFRVATYIFAFIQTSAALILLFSIMVVALPAFFIIVFLIISAAIVENARNNHAIEKLINNRKTFVFLALSPSAFDINSFFRANITELSMRENTLIIVVSPFLLSSKGLYGARPYISAKTENHSVIIIRKNYFYSLKKKILRKHSGNITVVL